MTSKLTSITTTTTTTASASASTTATRHEVRQPLTGSIVPLTIGLWEYLHDHYTISLKHHRQHHLPSYTIHDSQHPC
ncbi:hypothetical protein E2C01_096941 [Portunus trituberculatus]|uniref:Uncharacterized protein n=1 Tax=Portunus trituberculatus TaxID=210409 RepID=A0A5B7JZ48_PORTR|nr:hypothetical protein [Portunus trituberculatus]